MVPPERTEGRYTDPPPSIYVTPSDVMNVNVSALPERNSLPPALTVASAIRPPGRTSIEPPTRSPALTDPPDSTVTFLRIWGDLLP